MTAELKPDMETPDNCLCGPCGMKRKTHGAQEPKHINRIVEVASAAQRSDSPTQAINQCFLKRPDRLKLSGIKIFPHIGVTPEERAAPQECEADVVISGDWSAAAATDDLADSIDYCLILEKVQTVAAEREYVLLETLVHAIVQKVLTDFPVGSVKVKIRKRPAVLRNLLDFVEIEVEESSADGINDFS